MVRSAIRVLPPKASVRWTDAAWAISDEILKEVPKDVYQRLLGLRLARFGLKEAEIAAAIGMTYQGWCLVRAQLAAAEGADGQINLLEAIRPGRAGRPHKNRDKLVAERLRSGASDSAILEEMGSCVDVAYISRVRRLISSSEFVMHHTTIQPGEQHQQ